MNVIDQTICSEVLGKTKVFYCLRPVYQQSVLLPETCVPNKVFYCLRPVYQQSVLLPEACVPTKCSIAWGLCTKQSVLLPEACVPTKCFIAWGLCTKQYWDKHFSFTHRSSFYLPWFIKCCVILVFSQCCPCCTVFRCL